ncbi:MAG: hypothetical protein ACYC2U_04465 [Candidatus Amoebophilus sp.]
MKNLYIDKILLTTVSNIYIEKVDNLHMGKIELATSCYGQPADHHEPSNTPLLKQ